MRTYTKQPLDIYEQIAVLKERGLVFLQEENAINKLKQVSYFRLANYWKPMEQDKNQHTFKPQSTFENALSISKIQLLLEQYPNIDISAMGFPENWKEEPLWENKD